jgi:flavin reductase (DIM6/NTAB) family NADH-FMN oxidoreductase RutF
MTFDLRDYRSALASFATGVTIVTALDSKGNGHGLTVNSFASVSLEPPLVLWCLGNKSDSFELFSKCDAYAINILADQQGDLAMRFASASNAYGPRSPAGRLTRSRTKAVAAACNTVKGMRAGSRTNKTRGPVSFGSLRYSW